MSEREIPPLYVFLAAFALMLLGGFLAWGPGGGLFAIGLGVLLVLKE